MLPLNIQCSWWWAYVPETFRAKNTSKKSPSCIELAFRFISTEELWRTLLKAVGRLCTGELGKLTQWHLPSSFKSSSHLSYLDIVGLWNSLRSETWQSWEKIPLLTLMNGVISRMSGNRDGKNFNLDTRVVSTGYVCLRRPNAKQWHLIVYTSLIKASATWWLSHSHHVTLASVDAWTERQQYTEKWLRLLGFVFCFHRFWK